MTKPIIYLLDLNFTLVGNSADKKRQNGTYADKIAQENYRQWLVDLLRDQHVILCTVRHAKYAAQTLERIQALTGWQPTTSLFNQTDNFRGYIVKKAYLEQQLFPRYGTLAEQPYYAIESAKQTRAMYRRYGIAAIAAVDMRQDVLPPQPLKAPRPSAG